jgi:hypothetical protein
MPWRPMTTKVIRSGSRFGISGKREDREVDEIRAEVRLRAGEWQERSSRWRGCASLYMGSN